MKILVLGAGGIGGYYGARLIEAGADVTFVVREARRRQLARDGLRVQSPLGSFAEAVHAVPAVHKRDDFDLVILACKAYDLQSAIDAIAPALASGASVLPFINGIGVYDWLDGAFGRRRVLGGVAHIETGLFSDGVIRHLGSRDALTIGARAAESADIAGDTHALFARTPGERHLSAVIDQALWDKWTLLAAGAAACCLMRGTLQDIHRTDNGRALLHQAFEECRRVTEASGFVPGPDTLGSSIAFLMNPDSDWTASMMRDIAKNRPRIEADAIVGDMVKQAQRLGIPVPLLETAFAHLQVYMVRHFQHVQ
jgi:2-dehydropantoate 2-reductase